MYSFQEMGEQREAQRCTAECALYHYQIDVGGHYFLSLSLQLLATQDSSKRFPCLDEQERNVARNPDKMPRTVSLFKWSLLFHRLMGLYPSLPIFLKSRNADILLSRGNAILILGKSCFWKVQRGKQ